ncbi:hypothetical protein [Pleomorphovibrio marinus]|uniref:hypothetical protein n=1 Tax=Pleomorphovibrio marinus TaxID=2164132 RepID=UPI000E0C2AF1|nr:hypothetical protein [Pleomorphovibrio marinus]
MENINELKNTIEELALKRRDFAQQLSELKTKYRTRSTKYMNPKEYRKLCETQDRLKKNMNDLEKDIIILKKRKRSIEESINHEVLPNDLEQKLKLLRDKYLDFSADSTRVSSMRTMASVFVGEIEKIIKP